MTEEWIKFEGSKVVVKIEFNTLILYAVIILVYGIGIVLSILY